MQTEATFQSSHLLSCSMPNWGATFTATSLVLKVRGDGTVVDKHTFGLQYVPVYEYWLAQNETIGDAAGGTPIMLQTNGLIVDDRALPYECIFSDALGGTAVSVPVSPVSPSELVCIAPAWGRKNTAAVTSVSLYNRLRSLIVPYKGPEGSNSFEFTVSWARVQENYILASGGEISVIGAGLRTQGAYRCLLEGDDSRRLVSDLAHPMTPSTVICKISEWGLYHPVMTVNVTLIDGYGLHVFYVGHPVLRQVEIRESWKAVQPTYFLANAGMTVTVSGFGFHPERLYNCTLTWTAAGFWSELYNPAKWAPGGSVLKEEITTLPSSPHNLGKIICRLPQWGSLYAARNATLSVTLESGLSRELAFVGALDSTLIQIDPTWASITPTRYGWVGLGAITGTPLYLRFAFAVSTRDASVYGCSSGSVRSLYLIF